MTEELDGCPFECEINRKSDEHSVPSEIYTNIYANAYYPLKSRGLAEVSELNTIFFLLVGPERYRCIP